MTVIARVLGLRRQLTSEGGRPARRIVLAGAVLSILALAGLGWYGSRRPSIRDHWAAVARGRAYLQFGRPDLALEAVSQVRDEAPGSGEAMSVAGLALIRLGSYRSARLALERALTLQPNQFDAALTLAELNCALGNGRHGVAVLEQAARLRPREFRVWSSMAKVLDDLGDHPRAIQAYEKALALRPNDRVALVGLIGCLLTSDQSDEAKIWVARALQKFPDDPVVLGYAASAAFDANRVDEVFSLADRALARDPENGSALLTRARAHVARSQWDQALPDAERAVAVAPNDLGALQLLVKIQTRLGLKERAAVTQARRQRAEQRIARMNQLGAELARHPEDPQIPWKLGQTAQEAGSWLLAGRCYQAALALDPAFQPARQSLEALRAAHPELAQPSEVGQAVQPESK